MHRTLHLILATKSPAVQVLPSRAAAEDVFSGDLRNLPVHSPLVTVIKLTFFSLMILFKQYSFSVSYSGVDFDLFLS